MLCLHVVYSTVHSREIMDSLIIANYCRCILIIYMFCFVVFTSPVKLFLSWSYVKLSLCQTFVSTPELKFDNDADFRRLS